MPAEKAAKRKNLNISIPPIKDNITSAKDQNTNLTTNMSFATIQLQKYGWRPGQGLGKRGQGRAKALTVTKKADTKGVHFFPNYRSKKSRSIK